MRHAVSVWPCDIFHMSLTGTKVEFYSTFECWQNIHCHLAYQFLKALRPSCEMHEWIQQSTACIINKDEQVWATGTHSHAQMADAHDLLSCLPGVRFQTLSFHSTCSLATQWPNQTSSATIPKHTWITMSSTNHLHNRSEGKRWYCTLRFHNSGKSEIAWNCMHCFPPWKPIV